MMSGHCLFMTPNVSICGPCKVIPSESPSLDLTHFLIRDRQLRPDCSRSGITLPLNAAEDSP
jgi:hypothetical protein